MRKSPQETLRELRLLLARLKADWGHLDRPHVAKELRDSLYTRLVETEARIGVLEARLRRAAPAAE